MLSALRKENSPFSEQQISTLQQGIGQLDQAQTAWLSGYLAGKLAGVPINQASTQAATPIAPPQLELKVFYASQTGNGEQIALALAESAKQAGLLVQAQSLNDLRPAALKKVRHAVFIVSTHGEGDPPDDALDLLDFLEGPRAPRLDSLLFRVLALGDRSYTRFCAAGLRLEQSLLALGASTFGSRTDCDLDFEEVADQWSTQVLEYGLKELTPGDISDSGSISGTDDSIHLSVVPKKPEWHRKHPFPATVERAQKITGLESSKDVYHIELSLENSGIRYEPGDALGVWALNDPGLVAAVLEGLGIDAGTEVEVDGRFMSIGACLEHQRELTRLSPDTIKAYTAHSTGEKLGRHLEKLTDEQSRKFMEKRQFIDLVAEFPANPDAQGLADLLRPLAPRSYSIASSQAIVDDQVHLTVASLYSDAIGQQREGVASHFLNQRLQPGDEVGVFLEANSRFHLPQDRSAPLILIAAGTGVAPYRAFLQQLEEDGARAETWLIFGNPHMRTDFLYQREWLSWRSKGLLSRIDGAFSRDQENKRYVQHVVQENGAELERWLCKGAYIYICGSLAMGQEVERALRQTIAQQRGLDDEAATGFVAGLRRQRRLLKDLY